MEDIKQYSASKGLSTESSPVPEYRERWYSSALLSLFLNIFAGLLTTAILLYATSASRLFVVITILLILTLMGSTIAITVKNRRLIKALSRTKEHINTEKLRQLGIVDVTNAMADGPWSPAALMEHAQQSVCFLGVFGHKWVQDKERQQKFRAMLTRIQLNGGHVHFLLLNPNSLGAKQLAMYRNQDPDAYRDFPAIDFYKDLSKEFDCFQIRLFDHFPFLRLVLADGVCAISRFKTHIGADETMKAPQLVLAPEETNRQWTLYQAFSLLYHYLWEKARDPFMPLGHPSDADNACSDTNESEIISHRK